MNNRTVVIVPTCNAGAQFKTVMDALNNQTIELQIKIIDSESSDQTLTIAKQYDVDIYSISRSQFNHGGTRKMAIRDLHDEDVVVFLTQDAVLSSDDSIEVILSHFEAEDVAAVCGRQLPKENATAIERHARLFNYSAKSFVRSIKDKDKYGLRTAFMSNSFAAYNVHVLRKVGGFPDNVIFGEDMYVAAKLLLAGHEIAYAADACVYHSHNYSLIQEMRRYFDMGVFHAREPWVSQEFGVAESEALRFVISELQYLSRNAFWRIPESFLRTVLKYIGFRLGLHERRIPLKIKKKMSMNSGYFKAA